MESTLRETYYIILNVVGISDRNNYLVTYLLHTIQINAENKDNTDIIRRNHRKIPFQNTVNITQKF